MNEQTGFICCPNCKLPWNDGALACAYCHGTERPAALKSQLSVAAWIAIGCGLVVAAAIDRQFGGHVWHYVQPWFQASQ